MKRPLIVSFSGEVGVDGGGLRRNFLSMIVDYGVRVFERLGTEVRLDTADVDDIHFMLCVFLGKFLIFLCVKYFNTSLFFDRASHNSRRYLLEVHH